MKEFYHSNEFIKELFKKMPQSLLYFSYSISIDQKIMINSLKILNKERFSTIFENQAQLDFSSSIQEYFEKNPENWLNQIIEKDRKKWYKNLIELPHKNYTSFTLRINNIPFFISKENQKKFTLLIFCHLILLNQNEDSENQLYNALLIIEDINNINYLLQTSIKATPIGFFLYRDTFEFVNESCCKITGYKEEELYKLPVWEFAIPKIRDKVKKIAKDRISGKIFQKTYHELPIITKEGKIKWIQLFSNTVYLKSKPYGLGIFIEKTKEKKIIKKIQYLQKLYLLFLNLNEALLKSKSFEDSLKEILNILIESQLFKFIWIGKVDLKSKEVVPILHKELKEEYKNYLENLKISIDPNSPYSKGPTGRAFFTNTIQVNQNSKENPNIEPWKEKLLKFNFLSSATIPIETPKEKYVINLYCSKSNQFKKEILNLFIRLKANLEASLYRHYLDQWLKNYSYILENTDIVFFITDINNKILYTNSYTEKLYGYSFEELYNQDPRIFSSHLHSNYFYQNLWNTILRKEIFTDLFINRKKNGELVYIQQNIIPIVIDGKITHFASLGINLTDHIISESQSQIKFLFDPVTKLPNRKFFFEQIESILKMYFITDDLNSQYFSFSILNLDINKFHFINEVYGPEVGDFYLKTFSKILKKLLEELKLKFILCRSGNDEFFIFLYTHFNKITPDNPIILFLDKIIIIFLDKLKEISKKNYFIKDNIELNFSYHIGISLFPDDFTENELNQKNQKGWISSIVAKMIRNSELALFEAKKESEFSYKFYHSKMEYYTKSFIFIKQNIYNAIKNNEFVLYFQPYYEVKTLEIKGAEVLVRWIRKEEIIPPMYFIPYLEETGQITDLENIILEKALLIYKELQQNYKNIRISINISPITLLKTKFIDHILEKKEKLNFDPKNLVFEITETSLIENLHKVEEIINELKSYHFSFALDDFGKGYSSLSYLENLTIDIIKIDRSLIQDLHLKDKKKILAEIIVQLSEKFNFISIAEGVEKKEEFDIIKKLNFRYVQGYLFSKPVPYEDFIKIINSTP